MSSQNVISSMRIAAALLATAIAASCSSGPEDTTEFGDLALIGASVYTVDENQPWAEAVVVRDNSIIYVGNAEGASKLIGESTDVRDLGGQLLLPGFIDAHAHPVAGGAYATALSLETWGTVDEWVAAIAEYADANKDAELLFGY